jgi:hypothetical protein
VNVAVLNNHFQIRKKEKNKSVLSFEFFLSLFFFFSKAKNKKMAVLTAEQTAAAVAAKCKNGHVLTNASVPGKWGCDGCGTASAAGSTAHSCRKCNVDFCDSCAAGFAQAEKLVFAANEGKTEAEMISLPNIYTRHGKKAVNWAAIKAALPYDRSEEAVAKRDKIWKLADMNGNGFMSLAEVDKALNDVMRIEEIFDTKPVIIRAFNAAKGIGQGIKPPGWDQIKDRYEQAQKSRALNPVDYIEKKEFRCLIIYLHEYTALCQLFDAIDQDNDRRVTFTEFSAAVPLLRRLGITIKSPEATFKEIDKDGGGMILFEEFSNWALVKNLGAQISREGYSD